MSSNNYEIYKGYIESPLRSVKYDTYFPAYEKVLSSFKEKKSITLVEIGVHNGGSLYMWQNYFGKKANIIGIDLNPNAKKFEKDGFKIFIGDQADKNFWDNFFSEVGKVDIVIDDGGHTYEQQIITLNSCLSFINDGGVLITEDVHTSYFKSFGYPSKLTFVNWTKKIIDNINSRSENVRTVDNIYSQVLSSIEFFESLVVFNVDRQLAVKSKSISNDGETQNLTDFRYQSNLLNKLVNKLDKYEKKIYTYNKKNLINKILLRLISLIRENTLRFYNLSKVRRYKKYF